MTPAAFSVIWNKASVTGSYISLRAEDAVAGVAEAGDNVAVVIEALVQSGDEDIHVGMILLHTGNALGRADDAHELYVLDAVSLQNWGRSRS